MSITIRSCREDEYPFLESRLDREFIYEKGRSLSLAERFPHSMSPDNLEQIRIVDDDGEIRGGLIIRLFQWVSGKQDWRGAMIGMVWVDPKSRNRGYAGHLLRSIPAFLKGKAVDFGILWTGRPALYEKAGWLSIDRGVLAVMEDQLDATGRKEGEGQSLAEIDVKWLEEVRGEFVGERMLRNTCDYLTIPIPAERVVCFRDVGGNPKDGYALCGEQGRSGYLYEMVAPPEAWETYWYMISKRYERLVVNGRDGDPFCQWLEKHHYVSWAPQNKALWLPVSGRARRDQFERWYFPYFDWI